MFTDRLFLLLPPDVVFETTLFSITSLTCCNRMQVNDREKRRKKIGE
jgi:hypothetical protein